MKKIILMVLFSLMASLIWSADTYIENNFSFFSPKVLALGNSFVAEAHGLESFEFNPAGLVEDREITIFSGTNNLLSNVFQLSEDLLDAYNEDNDTSVENIGLEELSFILEPENREAIIKALLNQASKPYEDGAYANGLGYSPVLSLGFAGDGLGIGLLINMDSEVFGNELHTTELDSVITTSLLLGYAMTIPLGIVDIDVGVGARPMYKIRVSSELPPVIDLLLSDSLLSDNDETYQEMEYLTGIGFGWDLGTKVHFKDLTVGLSLIDMFGTNMTYNYNTYDDIVAGDFLGSESATDEYITPMSVKLGFSYNPTLGSMNSIFNPTLSADYKFLFVDGDSVEDYVDQSEVWNNLSIGLDIELFKFINARAGINQGYITLGTGIKLLFMEINAAVYSKEIGDSVGDRQQMGAAIEFAIRF
ncbi:MAG: hypothetical protein OCD02_22690 [Spirochaetaceae bacterium]